MRERKSACLLRTDWSWKGFTGTRWRPKEKLEALQQKGILWMFFFFFLLKHFVNFCANCTNHSSPMFYCSGTVKLWGGGGGGLITLPGKYTRPVCPETLHTFVRMRARMQNRSGWGRRAGETLESCIHLEVKKKNPGTPPSEPPARLLLSPPLQPQWPQRCGSL